MNGNPSAVSIHVLRGHTDPVCSAVFSSDGNFIASASTDNTVRIWSAETGRLLHTLNGHDAPPCAVAFTPNGTRLLSSGRDGQLIVWDVRTGAQLAVHEADGELHDVTIHPDGTHVVAAGAWGLYWLDLVD
jgi:WD40 repeat protein